MGIIFKIYRIRQEDKTCIFFHSLFYITLVLLSTTVLKVIDVDRILCFKKIWRPTLFNKNIAYADLVVSWPSKNKGNSIILMQILGETEFTTELTDDGSTEGE
jgi:hypothetical protein